MKKLIFLFSLITLHTYAQIAYQPNEVDIAAEPIGGAPLLNEFITSNIQIPFTSGYKGLNTRIFVKGVVETDGSMSELGIVKGLDTLSNLEAIRLLSLFKAWKPATLKNKQVRQWVTYPVSFKSAAVSNFDSTLRGMVDYYDANFKAVQKSSEAKFKSILPLDDRGNVKGNIVYQELNEFGKWKKRVEIPLKRNEIWYKESAQAVDSVRAYTLSVVDEEGVNYVPVVTINENGQLLSYKDYKNAGKLLTSKSYYLNGSLKKKEIFADSTIMETKWYKNGQLQSVIQRPGNTLDFVDEIQIFSAWDKNGNQVVKEGNGWLKIFNERSGHNPAIEQGEVAFGKRNGKWVGKLADSTVYYEEFYQNGKFVDGKLFKDGETVTYTEKIKQPYFKAGMSAFYQFLGQNLVYPTDALKKGISGRVFLSLVVNEDGRITDIKIIKGLATSIDREAMRVVGKMDGMWRPGMFRGEKISVRYNLPINFQMN